MDKIRNIKRYICGKEEYDFSELYRSCDMGKKELPINVFMLEHKKFGMMLINTGCSKLLKNNAVSFARFITKHKVSFTDESSIDKQLLSEKYDPSVIKKVLLTHCDPECCGGLKLLPRYELIASAQVLSRVLIADPADGIMPNLLPDENTKKTAAGIFKGKSVLNDYFKWVFDVFGDGTVLAADISGHSPAMNGFFLPEKNIFFAADASIDETAITQNLTPSDKLLRLQAYPDDYISVLATLRRLRNDHPEITFIFSHSENFTSVLS